MAESTSCEVCDEQIEGKPFTLSALTEPPSLLAACETCAGSSYITIRYSGLQVRVDRDDYIRADLDRLHVALDNIYLELEHLGWTLEAVMLHGRGDEIAEPYED